VKNYDLIIVGAGAAGLAAAIAFGRRCDGSVLLVEANPEPGKKILAAGNGRCNLSNTAAPGSERTKEFFDSLGVVLDTDEGGRVYPLSRRADAVRDALVRACERLGCAFMLRSRAVAIERGDDDDFVITVECDGGSAGEGGQMVLRAVQVVVATGGKARPAFGNLGDGYAFARAFGISVNPIRPALAPFVYADDVKGSLAVLAGVRAKAKVKLVGCGKGDGNPFSGGAADEDRDATTIFTNAKDVAVGQGAEVLAEADGEVQFTDYGLSGICVFDLSRYYRGSGARVGGRAEGSAGNNTRACANENTMSARMSVSGHSGDGFHACAGENSADHFVCIDFAPNHAEGEIAELLATGRAAGLAGIVHPKVAELIESMPMHPNSSVTDASRDDGRFGQSDQILSSSGKSEQEESLASADVPEYEKIAAAVKGFVVPVKGTKGWKDAQITVGGVAMDEVNEKYFESKAVPGLYFAGEILDYDGPSGGFNLDHAWNTGLKAGRAAGAYRVSLPTKR
jgi:predicted flavoprotein YhiN